MPDKISHAATRPSRKGLGKLSAMNSALGPDVYYLGLHNWLNGHVSNLFIGEGEIVQTVMDRQRRYYEKIQGWIVQSEGDSSLTFSFSTSGDPIITLSMIQLDLEGARRYYNLKAQAEEKNVQFFGIVSQEIGETDILYPIDPETGKLRLPDDYSDSDQPSSVSAALNKR